MDPLLVKLALGGLAVLGCIGLFFGIGLALAAHKFAVEVNPKSDRMAILFQCEGHWMGDIFDTLADTLHFDITMWAENDFLSVELLRNGVQIDFVSPGTDSFSWHPTDVPMFGESYYMVRAQQVDGDYLWSSPIWVTSTNQAWTAISAVNADDASGRPVLYGSQVTIKGLATVATGTFSTGLHTGDKRKERVRTTSQRFTGHGDSPRRYAATEMPGITE